MPRFLISLFAILVAFSAAAQERPSTILVLDGSGSMWGQIDGINKIVIARDVIGTILQDFPPDQALGLTVYGHRRKGDCSDIETMIAPNLGTVESIIGAVNKVNPKGKTPLSAAVIAAAEALRYTEERATVILVSDGIETCELDPCAVGRQLEELGVDFTAHVVGFDVENDPAARAQLQCLAEETGGIFRTASNASELTEALTAISEPPAPEPTPVSFTATEGAGGPQIRDGLVWAVSNPLGVPLVTGVANPAPVLDLLPGDYTATVTRTVDDAHGTVAFTVADAAQTVTIALPDLIRPVEVTFRATEGENGPAIFEGLTWNVSNALGVPLATGNTDGRPALTLDPGPYAVSVTRAEDGETAQGTFTVSEADNTVTLVLPKILRPQDVTFLAKAGGLNISEGLEWTSTAADGTIVLQDSSDATPSTRLMPGTYSATVVRTVDGATVNAGFTVAETAQTVILNLPELPPEPVRVRAFAIDGRNGPRIDENLIWDLSGPDGAILSSEQTPNLDLELAEGTYTVFVMRPADESTAELRFGVGEVEKTITLELPEFRPLASVSAPASAPQGATVPLEWTGPNAKDDYISVSAPDAKDGTSINYTYTREGPLLDLLMPPEPGIYEIRYILNDGRKTLAKVTIQVTPVTASVAHSGDLVAGNTIAVDWTGPDYKDDFIGVTKRGEERQLQYTYTREGTPLDLRLPSQPGEYELVYIMQQGRTILTRMPITVADVSAAVSGPTEGLAGASIAVDWTGPDYKDDYIAITKAGSDKWEEYTYTREGSPLDLRLPTEPGSYEIAYFMQQDSRILTRAALTVSDVAATVSGPAQGVAGATIQVDWTGPDYKDDYVAVVKRGEDRWRGYTHTREGTPLDLTLPVEPGDYDLVYVLQQDSKILARNPITITDVGATLTAPETGLAGADVSVDWTGPDYNQDFIAVVERGKDKWGNYTYTREGTPLTLTLPVDPGEYDIAYVLQQDRRIIARRPITVSDVSATIAAPADLPAGATVQIDWTGPDYNQDFIAVTERGADRWINYTYTREGSPLGLKLPPEPGDYDLAYVLNQDREILLRVPVTVTGIDFSVSAPATGPVGGTVSVDWTGPDYDNDFIAIAKPGDTGYEAYTYTRTGSPLTLQMPNEPGLYEIRYVLSQGRLTKATVGIEVTGVDASVSGPATAVAGSDIPVDWTGPGYQNDFVAIASVGMAGDKYAAYVYTRTGQPATLTLPLEPGNYELRYIMATGGRTLLARTPITLTAVTASLDAPATAAAGEPLSLGWTGPDYKNDFVAIAEAGNRKNVDYFYTRTGNPGMLDMPDTPGTYELRYIAGQGQTVIHSQPITLE